MMPMAAQDENSLPFRGGSGWGMSTHARSAWQGPAPEQTPTPIRQQTAFPREGGDPDWAPAFAGEQGSARGRTIKRARENKEAGVVRRKNARPCQTGQPPPTPHRTKESYRHHSHRWPTCQSTVLHARRSAPSPDADPRTLHRDTAPTPRRRRENASQRLHFLYFRTAA